MAAWGCDARDVRVERAAGSGGAGGGPAGGDSTVGGGAAACSSDWVTQLGPVDTFANRHTLAASSDCSTYVAGRFGASLALGDTVLEGAANATNVFLAHLDPRGAPLWSRAIGGEGAYTNPVLAATRSGGVVLSGTLSGAVDFGEGVVESAERTPFLAAYDADGALRFARVFTTQATDVDVRSVAAGPSGEIWIAGTLWGSVSFGAITLTTPEGTGAGFVARFNPDDGEPAWARLLDTSYSLPVVVNSKGRAILGSPERVLQLDAQGNTIWSRDLVGDAGYVNDIAVGANDSLIVAGAFSGQVDLGFGPVGVGAPGGDAEGFVLALDDDGHARWARTWVDPEAWQVIVSAGVRSNGDIVVFGEDRDFWHAVFLEELSPEGALVAHQTFTALCTGQTVCDTIATGMRLDQDGNVLLAAELQGSMSIDGTVVDSSDANDMVVAKLTQVVSDPD
ncbi:MAG: hypothetical protein U0414_31680 [Polyangiaceae bacterium]